MMDITTCKKTIQDSINQLTTARELVAIVRDITDVKSENYEKVTNLMVDMKTTSESLKSALEVFDEVFNVTLVACMMSVYAGKIEESGHWDENDPDADSFPHIQEYIEMACEYDIPQTEKGQYIVDETQYQLYQMMKEKYYKENTKYDIDIEFDKPVKIKADQLKPINDILKQVLIYLNDYIDCKGRMKLIGELLKVEDQKETINTEDVIKCLKYIKNIPNTIYVALMAAVYAGNIEGAGWGFKDEFGADSLDHLDEYLDIAEKYEIPIDDDGKYATDCVHTDISNIVHAKYNTEENDSET